MPDSFFSKGLAALSGLLDPDQDPLTVREQVVQGLHPEGTSDDEKANVRRQVDELMERKRVKQPEAVIPDVVDDSIMQPVEDIVSPDAIPEFDIGEPLDVSSQNEIEAEESWRMRALGSAVESIQEETLGADMSKTEARVQHWDEVKQMENPGEMGLTQTPTGTVFMPFDVPGFSGAASEVNIGYGIKVDPAWLKDDKKKWPVVDGVPVNVKNGITREQAKTMGTDILEKSYDQAKKVLGTEWGKATEREKSFWADLTYNGGAGAMAKNAKAMTAAKKGLGVEAMIKSLDYIKVDGKKVRGLLNRRISMYNQAALGISGAPIIESYEFGSDIKVKFSSNFMTSKMGKGMTKKINDNDGWYKVTGGPAGETISREVNEDYNFEG